MKISSKFKKGRLRTRVVKNIETVPPIEWNKIYPKVPENYFFLKTLDESRFEQFSFYYILIYERKELVGAAPCFSLNYSLDTSINGPLRRLTNSVKKVFPHLFEVKALVCGIPMGQGHMGLAGNRGDVIKAIERRMEALARKMKALFLAFKDFDVSYDDLFIPLQRIGYMKVDSLPMTRLGLDFPDFENYLKSLSGANRYDLRRKFKRTIDIKIDADITSSLDEATLEEVYGLYLQAVETHDRGFEIVPKDFFRLISKNCPKETRFFLWRTNGKLVAFGFCLVTGATMLDYFLGFDPACSHQYHLYFVRFKGMMEWCLAHGVKTYEMGATGYEPKRRLKFEFVPVYLYIKARYKLLHPCFKLLCSLLKSENFDPELKRWKSSHK